MKKILFFAIFVLVFGIARSQVFQDVQDHTRLTEVYIDNTYLQGYTQKVLPYTNKQHIALTKTSEGKNVFILLKNAATEIAERVAIYSEFIVKDFDIFEGKLYFCGSYNENGYEEAFLAYAEIDDFFFPVNTVPTHPLRFKYTIINDIYQDSIFSIDRIEVFKDTSDIVVAGIGKMYYGKPPYQVLKPSPTGGAVLELVDPAEYYLDFFMLYTIKEDTVVTNQYDVALGDSATYGIANKFEMFYVPSDASANSYFNKFADITETNDKIYITSVNYSDTSINHLISHAAFIDLISFDKITRQQTAGRIHLPFDLHQSYGVKTTQISNNDIAIVFNACYNAHDNHTCALRVTPNATTTYSLSNISVFDTLKGGFRVSDCEYLSEENELVVLKNSLIRDEKTDIVFHLKINKDTTSLYTYYKYRILTKDNYYLHYSDLSKFNDTDYTIAGSGLNNNMFIYDTKNTAYLSDSLCFQKLKYEIKRLNPFPVTTIPNLSQCQFSRRVVDTSNFQFNILYFSTSVHDAIIQLRTIPFNRYAGLNTECLK